MAQIKAFPGMLQNLCHLYLLTGRFCFICGFRRFLNDNHRFLRNLSLNTFLNLSSFGAITNAQ
jgi:hypothetical protein